MASFERKLSNLRLTDPPAIQHDDFEMWQYNNTQEARKVFSNNFDFAVIRQGYNDYSRRETSPSKCELNKQWILFKARNREVLKTLKHIDFTELSQNNTITPGFGKADVVKEYAKVLNESS